MPKPEDEIIFIKKEESSSSNSTSAASFSTNVCSISQSQSEPIEIKSDSEPEMQLSNRNKKDGCLRQSLTRNQQRHPNNKNNKKNNPKVAGSGKLSSKWTREEEKILFDAWKANPPNFTNLTLDLPNRDRRNIKRKFDKIVATIYNYFKFE
ncbi:1737_t:CDS:2 [Ambispora leptoticha]|uniref:1737_t:CDS:1 n=1 Tax=Ambispora leptoticha TaxID=144679 RepID=A0A9N9GEK9_9GLOM|nr:1737_t:CDS:2 [Ambispora leptoticha]